MTIEDAIKHAEEVADYDCYNKKQFKCAEEHRQLAEWLKDYKRLLKQESCEDCISRKAVLDKIKEVCFSREQEWVDFRVSQGSNGQRDLIINFIEDLPSVQPKTDILDKIRADVINIADGRRSMPVRSVINIINKYRESEEND